MKKESFGMLGPSGSSSTTGKFMKRTLRNIIPLNILFHKPMSTTQPMSVSCKICLTQSCEFLQEATEVLTAKIVFCAFETAIIAIRGIQVPVNGYIIQESEDDYCGKEERQHPGGESRAARDKMCLESVQPHVSNS